MSERKPSVRSTAGDSGTGERVVPLRRQYLDIKQRYPDVLLFFRLGDFYETFENDAIVAVAGRTGRSETDLEGERCEPCEPMLAEPFDPVA